MDSVKKVKWEHIHIIEVPDFLNIETVSDLHKQWNSIDVNLTKFVLLINKSSYTFCKGMDIVWISENTDNDSISEGMTLFASFLENLQNSSYISIAAIDGIVQGGGLGIVSASDLVLATHQSSFQLSEGLLGLVPGIILSCLLTRLKPQQIKKMVFSAKKYSAEEACYMGLVDEVMSAENLETSLDSWLRQFELCKRRSIVDLKFILSKNQISSLDLQNLGITLLRESLRELEIKERLENLAYFLETQ